MDGSRSLSDVPLALGSITLTGGDWLLIAALVAALLLAALSAAAETAFTSVSRIRIRNQAEEGDAKAQRILRLLEKPESFLSAILITSNVAVIVASSVGTLLALRLFGTVGEIVETIALSILVLIFCEITPKTAAVQAPERGARFLLAPVEAMRWVLRPLIVALTFVTNGIVRLFTGGPVRRGPFVTEEELRMLVEVGEQEGVLEEEEREMIHNVFELADTTVREIMVPRIDMVTIEADASVDDAIRMIVEGGQSRIPVYAGEIDDIIGVLYAKDLLRVLALRQRPPSIRSLVRKAYFVPESKRLDDLLREMQRQRVHIAIVVDEYGSVAGLVTIEDVVEEIIGDIQDEYDKEEQLIQPVGDGEYIVDAKISLDELNEELDTQLTSEDYETLGGFVFAQLDKIPSPGDVVRYDGWTMTVLGTKGRRITKVRLVHTGETQEGGADPSGATSFSGPLRAVSAPAPAEPSSGAASTPAADTSVVSARADADHDEGSTELPARGEPAAEEEDTPRDVSPPAGAQSSDADGAPPTPARGARHRPPPARRPHQHGQQARRR